jgi:hypothetical protein
MGIDQANAEDEAPTKRHHNDKSYDGEYKASSDKGAELLRAVAESVHDDNLLAMQPVNVCLWGA